MKTSFIQFLLIFSVLSLLFFPQTSVQGAKNGLILWSATITPTLLPFLLLTGFMQYYQTFHLISRLFYPLKKLFPGINEDFFYTCILGFFCGCPLLRSQPLGPRIHAFPCLRTDRKYLRLWISLLDILLHWSFMAKFLLCAFSFACIFLSCVIWSIWSFYFLQAIFYIHTTLLPPLHTKSQQIR